MTSTVRLAALAAAVILCSSCTSGPGPVVEKSYEEDVRASRARKDQMLRTDNDSPIPATERKTFAGLLYYDIKPEFRVPASLTLIESDAPVIIEMQQTDKTTEKMRKVGQLGFAVGGVKYTLTAYASLGDRTMEGLFVPFGDLTNTTETYGGGRFLNLRRTSTGLYDLDFNQAYNPYCVYNPEWICPVPPRENRLSVAIPAGEKLPANKTNKK